MLLSDVKITLSASNQYFSHSFPTCLYSYCMYPSEAAV